LPNFFYLYSPIFHFVVFNLKFFILYSLFWRTYMVHMSQFMMVCALLYIYIYIYILQLWSCHNTIVCISHGKSNLHVAFLHFLMSCLYLCNEADFLWRVVYGF
jgi:hypothetical protein